MVDTSDDLLLLDAVVERTRRRVTVPAFDAFALAYGYPPGPEDYLPLRLSILRLERDELLVSDRELRLEPTPDGEVAVEVFRSGRRHRTG